MSHVRWGLQCVSTFTATSSGHAVSFTDRTSGVEFAATHLVFLNEGSTSDAGVYVNFTSTTGASTGDWMLYPTSTGATRDLSRGLTMAHELIPDVGVFGISCITSGGASAPCRVLAIRA